MISYDNQRFAFRVVVADSRWEEWGGASIPTPIPALRWAYLTLLSCLPALLHAWVLTMVYSPKQLLAIPKRNFGVTFILPQNLGLL